MVGVTFTGSEVADFLHAATIAIVGEVPLTPAAARDPGVPHPQRDLAVPVQRPGSVGAGQGRTGGHPGYADDLANARTA